MMCRTFTHHVGGSIRVECAAHPRWIYDADKTHDQTARQVATAAQASHEAEGSSVWCSLCSGKCGGH